MHCVGQCSSHISYPVASYGGGEPRRKTIEVCIQLASWGEGLWDMNSKIWDMNSKIRDMNSKICDMNSKFGA